MPKNNGRDRQNGLPPMPSREEASKKIQVVLSHWTALAVEGDMIPLLLVCARRTNTSDVGVLTLPQIDKPLLVQTLSQILTSLICDGEPGCAVVVHTDKSDEKGGK